MRFITPSVRPGLLVLTFTMGTLALAAPADEPGTITGKVVGAQGEPAADAELTLVELRRRTTAGQDGTFQFEKVPPGSYLIQAVSRRFGSAIGEIAVASGATARIEIQVDLGLHAEEIVVTSSPGAKGLPEVYQPAAALSGTQLSSRMQATLGETLAQEPGVSSTHFGAGASRPVIRGLGGDRIRVLEDGIGTGDASNISPDHAVSRDPLSAQKIEIVRGPATLLYGSSAVGGVVNVLDDRIPSLVPKNAVTGTVDARLGSVSDERTGGLSVDGGFRQFAWHVDGLTREAGDYDTPDGRMKNSDLDNEQATIGASWVANNGYLGASYSGFNSDYGNPAEATVRVEMEQRRTDLHGEWQLTRGFFSGIRVRAGNTNYEHVELEDGAVGTRFINDQWEARLEAPHRQTGPFAGTFGVQASRRDFSAIGDEAFLPPSETDNEAIFAFEEVGTGGVRIQFGGRYEHQDVTSSDAGVDRSISTTSGAAGVIWRMKGGWSIAVNAHRTERAPTTEELLANGPHIATERFEVGDPDLDTESALGADIALRRREGRVTGEINLFFTRFDDFVIDKPRLDAVDPNLIAIDPNTGLEIFDFIQTDADFAGGELHVDVELLHKEPHHLTLEVGGDLVRAEERDTDEPLPRISPARFGLGLSYQGTRWWGRVEGRRVQRQTRVADLETETDGFTMLNAIVGYRFLMSRVIQEVVLRGTNLTDAEARNHVSQIKDLVLLPGADVTLSYRLIF